MSGTDRLSALFVTSGSNAVLAWLFVVVLLGTAVVAFVVGRYEALLFTGVAVGVVVAPAVVFRDPAVMPPWYFHALICLPVLWRITTPFGVESTLVPTVSMATVGLLLMVELHRFTRVQLVPWLSVVLTVLFTLAMASLLTICRWLLDTVFGTAFLLDGRPQLAINTAVMVQFVYATATGVVAGYLFYRYLERCAESPDSRMVAATPPETETPSTSALLSERMGVTRTRQRRMVRVLQTALVVVFAAGVWARRLPIVINAGGALAITFLPAMLERDYGIPIAPGLAVWVTSAVFLHALGTAALYDVLPHWDTLTHTFSATIVAAVGYTTLRVVHLHAPSVHLPPWATFAFTIVFILAIGVVWELLEFAVDRVALWLEMEPALAQHGIDDTVTDMLFNTVGAVAVSLWGTTYLVYLSDLIAIELEDRLNP